MSCGALRASLSDFDLVKLGAATLNENGEPVVQGHNPVEDSDADTETYGEIDMASALGVWALPAAADDDGHAEGVLLFGCGGASAVCVGGRDVRVSRDVIAQLGPGETCLGATGKGFDSRVFCKDQAVSIVVGDDTILHLSRKEQKFVVAVAGALIEISEENGGIALYSPNGANGITITNDCVHIMGKVVLGGMVPNPALSIMLGPPTGSPAGVASVPLMAAMGVSIGL